MKRDMETVRRLLIAAEGAEGYLQIKDPEEAFHVALMLDAGGPQESDRPKPAFVDFTPAMKSPSTCWPLSVFPACEDRARQPSSKVYEPQTHSQFHWC